MPPRKRRPASVKADPDAAAEAAAAAPPPPSDDDAGGESDSGDAGSDSGSDYDPAADAADAAVDAEDDVLDDDVVDHADDADVRGTPKKKGKRGAAGGGTAPKKKVKREPAHPIDVKLGKPAGWHTPEGYDYVLAK